MRRWTAMAVAVAVLPLPAAAVPPPPAVAVQGALRSIPTSLTPRGAAAATQPLSRGRANGQPGVPRPDGRLGLSPAPSPAGLRCLWAAAPLALLPLLLGLLRGSLRTSRTAPGAVALQAMASRLEDPGDPPRRMRTTSRPWDGDSARFQRRSEEPVDPPRRRRNPRPWDSDPEGSERRYPREVPERDRRPRMGPPPGSSDMQPWYPPRPPKAPREEGVDFLFGVAPVRAALRSNRRKPLTLYVQEAPAAAAGGRGVVRKDEGAHDDIRRMAAAAGIPIEAKDKGELNTLTDNKPHQGVVLRCEPLEYVPLPEIPPPSGVPGECWLALDEVTDPMNLGAVLRSAFFLRASGVVVSARNSAPLSPVVSKASASAMEVMQVRSTTSMVNLLTAAAAKGWRVVGATIGPRAVDLQSLPPGVPTIVVLGNEGHGLRTPVARACTDLVRIGPPPDRDTAVDSLNVSVAGGILLHHLLPSAGPSPDVLPAAGAEEGDPGNDGGGAAADTPPPAA